MTAIPNWDTVGGADNWDTVGGADNWGTVGPSDSDAELALAAAAGDKRAFADIYDRYSNRLYDFCVGMLADRDGAADCVQEVFCIAATRLSQLRDPRSLRPWLYSIARNEALRRIRDRRREEPSDDLPDEVSDDPGPDMLAARTELADLIADAAGGLSDRDRSVLELAFRHGLDGPDLAEALGVTAANANTIVHRLRATIERSLGALLLSRRVRNGGGCPELSAILDGWDGHFNVLMRKRISRHMESCATCDEERRRLVSPVALLGAAPVFVPAPAWLRDRTLSQVELTCAASPTPGATTRRDSADAGRNTSSSLVPIAAFVSTLLAALALTFVWLNMQTTTIPSPIQVGETAPPPVAPLAPASPPPPAPTAEPIPPAEPPTRHAPPVEQPSAGPSPAAAPTVTEPTSAPPPPAPPAPPVPPVPPPPAWPDVSQWPQWQQWPEVDPGGPDPDPGTQFTGPSGIAGIPLPDSSVPG